MSLDRMLAALSVLACACGPRAGNASPTDATWLVGVYSLQAPTTTEAADSLVDRYTFEEDGAAVRQKISFERVTGETSLTWELATAEAAFVYPAPFNEDEDVSYSLRPGADCNTLAFTYLEPNGATLGPASLYRGEVCARAPDPEVPSYYERYWCDEPPPPCEDP